MLAYSNSNMKNEKDSVDTGVMAPLPGTHHNSVVNQSVYSSLSEMSLNVPDYLAPNEMTHFFLIRMHKRFRACWD